MSKLNESLNNAIDNLDVFVAPETIVEHKLTEGESFEDELMFKIKKTVEGTNGVENTSDPEYYPGAMFEHSFTFDYNGERYVVGLTVQDTDDEDFDEE